MVACNHCVFYNKLHFRTFLPRRKVHGQKDYSKAGSGISISKTMGNGVELPFLGNYSLRTLIFQIAMYQRSVWTREKMINTESKAKMTMAPPKSKQNGQVLISRNSERRIWENANSELRKQRRNPYSFCVCLSCHYPMGRSSPFGDGRKKKSHT